jgi:hypothetical protein
MTKQMYIDYCYNESYGKMDNLTKTMVEIAINNTYNQVCVGVKKIDICRKRFTAVPVIWDTVSGCYYSNYPAAIVPNLNADMIVSTIKGSGLLFYPTTESSLRIASVLPCSDLNTHIETILKRERIEYYNMESLSLEEIENGSNPTPRVPTISIDLAIQFKEFLSTDVVYMPNGRDYEVLQLAIDFLKQNPIMDIRNE